MSVMPLLKPGHWYFYVVCNDCQKRHLLFGEAIHDVTEIPGTYQSTCPSCLSINFYDGKSIERYFMPEALSAAS